MGEVEKPPQITEIDEVTASNLFIDVEIEVNTTVSRLGSFEGDDCEELTAPPRAICIELDVKSYVKGYFTLFQINKTWVYALVDGGSPYSFIDEELYKKIIADGADFGQKQVPNEHFIVLSAFGKVCAKVLELSLIHISEPTRPY